MRCPACGTALSQARAGDITVDVCKGGCGGIWFDRFELTKVDEPRESAGEALLDIERKPGLRIDLDRRRSCPRCGDMIMMRHFSSAKRQVVVDECPRCAGIWLDAGELRTIRTEFMTEADRRNAADAYFAEIFGKHLAELRQRSEADAARAR
jgi:Zn-finger nucleic acid-binding protein